jgi:DNA/RNA endonuclease YhcR with UshA esterase domain
MRAACVLLTVILCAALSFADDKPTTQPADADAAVIKPEDHDAIVANMDKDVVIEGTIDKAEWSKSGKVMIATFEGGAETKLQAVLFVANREKFDSAFSGDVSKALTGAKVKIKGKLKDYKGSPEVVMDKPDQITIVEAAAEKPATTPG